MVLSFEEGEVTQINPITFYGNYTTKETIYYEVLVKKTYEDNNPDNYDMLNFFITVFDYTKPLPKKYEKDLQKTIEELKKHNVI